MYKILVVDDEVRIRSIIRKYAEFEGHSVTEAGDGMEAVNADIKISSFRLRLILPLDVEPLAIRIIHPQIDILLRAG